MTEKQARALEEQRPFQEQTTFRELFLAWVKRVVGRSEADADGDLDEVWDKRLDTCMEVLSKSKEEVDKWYARLEQEAEDLGRED